MRSLSSGAKLVVQDIVDSSGWSVPNDVTSLLAESSRHGAIINSWSWGDNTVNYTERSSMIDKWTVKILGLLSLLHLEIQEYDVGAI